MFSRNALDEWTEFWQLRWGSRRDHLCKNVCTSSATATRPPTWSARNSTWALGTGTEAIRPSPPLTQTWTFHRRLKPKTLQPNVTVSDVQLQSTNTQRWSTKVFVERQFNCHVKLEKRVISFHKSKSVGRKQKLYVLRNRIEKVSARYGTKKKFMCTTTINFQKASRIGAICSCN